MKLEIYEPDDIWGACENSYFDKGYESLESSRFIKLQQVQCLIQAVQDTFDGDARLAKLADDYDFAGVLESQILPLGNIADEEY